MKPLLSVNNLTVRFDTEAGTSTAVENISFQVHRGEIVAIVGESGSGKSVTALSILQLLPPQITRYPSGQIIFSAEDGAKTDIIQMNNDQIRELRKDHVGIIFQEPMTSLNPLFTCGNQVMEAVLLSKKRNKKEAKARTLELFEQVKLPSPEVVFKKYPHELSGGQKQRVMIAMAMAGEPDLLICDEPTTALDVTVQKTILDLIRDLQKQTGMAVIFITHDLGIVREIAHRALVMFGGKIVEEGTTKKIFDSPGHPYTKALLACRPALHPKGERLPTVEQFMENQPPKLSTKTSLNSPTRDPLIEVRNLTVRFDDFIAVKDVSFDLFKGETLGLVGESGSGKTTLGRALLRLIKPSTGSIILEKKNIAEWKESELRPLRVSMQLIFQDPYSSLNPRIRIGEAIAEPLQVHFKMTAEERKEKVLNLLKQVDLEPDYFDRYPHEFSGGQRQRIVIARALALNPSFLVCDESVSALDVSVQAQVLNLLNDLKAQLGFTVIFISHDLSVVHYMSDRIMVMNRGEIVESGPADKVYTQPDSAYTQRLIKSIPGRLLA